MDIIPIQASSVACEQVFSSGKQTMTPRRGRISAQLMEALQILKFAIRKEEPLKLSDMTWKEELKEFERLAWAAPPSDAEAYGRNLEDDKGDSDIVGELDEQEINLEVLGEQLILGLDNEEGKTDDEEMYV